jgi:tetraacyldisaccharide 4'-kinase
LPPSSHSVDAIWRRRGFVAWLLLPAAFLFQLLIFLRRLGYRCGLLAVVRLPVPVVVIGGITVGGSGKTPLIVWLAAQLCARGRRPGIVSRGYRGSYRGVRPVTSDASAAEVGDEPLLIHRRTGVPVYVGRRRAEAAQALLAAHACDVILCDDGLQHYALARDLEIVVLDGRGLGNGWLMPAGPLRESPARLDSVAAVVGNDWPGPAAFRMRLVGREFYRLDEPSVRCLPEELLGRRLHAVAGIGAPQRFFDHLRALGLTCECHAFADHYAYGADDLRFVGDAILTTEKDAVKLAGLAALPVWVLPVDAEVEPDLAQFVLERIDGCPSA